MPAEYIPVVLFFVLAAAFPIVTLFAAKLVRPVHRECIGSRGLGYWRSGAIRITGSLSTIQVYNNFQIH